MAGYLSGDTRKVTTHRLIEMKQRGEKISMLTSYDYTMAQIVDGAGVDVILAAALKEDGVGFAVMNRMFKSAGYNIIEV